MSPGSPIKDRRSVARRDVGQYKYTYASGAENRLERPNYVTSFKDSTDFSYNLADVVFFAIYFYGLKGRI